MKNNQTILLGLISFLNLLISCNKQETASELLKKTINTIDTIETIYYKQDLARTNPGNIDDTISQYREMYFKRLMADSIVGVKGHWYMYVNDKENVIFEDIYDGDKLIRKNNRDSATLIYDLVKYPEFKKKHFWGHNTLYAMQYEFKYILNNSDSYLLERLNDTIIRDKNCFQILIRLVDKISMPGFDTQLEDKKGSVSKSFYCIDKKTYYPINMKLERYTTDNPNQIFFIDQKYYDIKFNLNIDEDVQFNTSDESIAGFNIINMKPE